MNVTEANVSIKDSGIIIDASLVYTVYDMLVLVIYNAE